jgi:hypothetical protein
MASAFTSREIRIACEEEGFIAGPPTENQLTSILRRLIGESAVPAEEREILEKKVCDLRILFHHFMALF